VRATFPASPADCAAARAAHPDRAAEPCVITAWISNAGSPAHVAPSPACNWYNGGPYTIGESGPLGAWWFNQTVTWQVCATLGLHNMGQNCNQWYGFGYQVSVIKCAAWHTWGMLVPPNDNGLCYWSGDNLTWQMQVAITWSLQGIGGGFTRGVSISVESCGDAFNAQFQ
jgi:hypothetical protein